MVEKLKAPTRASKHQIVLSLFSNSWDVAKAGAFYKLCVDNVVLRHIYPYILFIARTSPRRKPVKSQMREVFVLYIFEAKIVSFLVKSKILFNSEKYMRQTL